jgi:hypothetical protein
MARGAAIRVEKKGTTLAFRSSGCWTIFVGMALMAGCSGAEPNAPPPSGCTNAACSDAAGDRGSRDDGSSDDATTSLDSGLTIDGGSVADAASDGGGSTDARSGEAGADGTRPLDGAVDLPARDGIVDVGSTADAASDVTPPLDAGADGNGGGTIDAGDLDEVLHLNDIQMEGSHNSYHVETTGGIIPAWHYTHQPLNVQLASQGVRQFELDIHYNGPNDFLVHHVPPDIGTTCTTLPACLGTMKTWSDAHPRHAPLVVLIEQKDEFDGMKISGHYDELDALLVSIWTRERIITPDEVRGQRATLREAVTTNGWPTLGKTRGRILFAFIGDSTEYMTGHPNLENRVVFPRATVSDPFAAFVLLDNAQNSEADITNAVRQGFIVRTRYNGEELRLVPAVLEAAQRGGAHCLSGDFPVDFALTAGAPSRCNPVRAPAGCTASAVEQL